MIDPSTPNLAEMARMLSQSDEYRVIRKLQKRDSYGMCLPGIQTDIKIGLILDTETTGLEAQDRVLELGIIRFEFDSKTGLVYRILDTYGALEDPGIRIAEAAQAVHGISAAMVKGKQFDDLAVARILSGADVVIAHNARFDRPMIEKRYPAFALHNWACSYQEIDWKGQGFGSSSLEFLAYKHGFFYEAHGAEMDCRAVLEILQTPTQHGPLYLKSLYGNLQRIEERIWALNASFDRKDLLKERGYRWNSEEPKAWWRSLPRSESKAERKWLLKNVYQSNSAKVRIDVVDATSRYSNRLTDSRTHRITLDEPV